MQRKTIALVAALAVLLAGAGAYANTDDEITTTPYGCYGHGPAALTDEQQKAMLELRLELLDSDLSMEEIHTEMQALRAELGIEGPGFIDEDGDGVCDNYGQRRKSGYGRGYGNGPGGCGMGYGGFGHMGRW
jgi:hypothetical protein